MIARDLVIATFAEIRDDVIEEVRLRLASQRETEMPEDLKPPAKASALDELEKEFGPSADKQASLKPNPVPDGIPNANKMHVEAEREESDGG